MAHDELLRLLNTAIGTGDPEQDISATGTGANARFVGKNKAFRATMRVGGDISGTPTLDMRIQESANGTSGWVTVATFPQVTTEQVGYVATTTPRYEVPRTLAQEPPSVAFETTKDYLKADWTLGSAGVLNDVSVELYPLAVASGKRSGLA